MDVLKYSLIFLIFVAAAGVIFGITKENWFVGILSFFVGMLLLLASIYYITIKERKRSNKNKVGIDLGCEAIIHENGKNANLGRETITRKNSEATNLQEQLNTQKKQIQNFTEQLNRA